jgi:hypothetical protein
MTVEDIRTRKEGQTFDRKSIRTETEQKQDGNRTETGIRLTEIRVDTLGLSDKEVEIHQLTEEN